jgi:CheY-like chemotaxis protein
MELVLSDEERKSTNVLVVEDNPVNQQIALKTIAKLGFPVRAVWNGQEALDYLKSSSKDKPIPDVILMDVQMPIMDGYTATSTIRNDRAFAYNADLQGTPIVAMTASAIQGDREKCQAAGMDDYLSKPVKKQNLEKMIIKWAIQGRRKRAELRANPSLLRSRTRPSVGHTASFTSESSVSLQTPQEHLASEVDRLEFVNSHRFAASSESNSERVERQQRAEEQAMSLRDHELIESGEDPKTKLGKGVGEEIPNDQTPSTTALTMENMEQLNMEQFASTSRLGRLRREHTDGDNSSTTANPAETDSKAPRTTQHSPEDNGFSRGTTGFFQ